MRKCHKSSVPSVVFSSCHHSVGSLMQPQGTASLLLLHFTSHFLHLLRKAILSCWQHLKKAEMREKVEHMLSCSTLQTTHLTQTYTVSRHFNIVSSKFQKFPVGTSVSLEAKDTCIMTCLSLFKIYVRYGYLKGINWCLPSCSGTSVLRYATRCVFLV